MNKKISVLIANYNNQKYIHECIKSLTDQTYDNLEIIVFDDCSSDESILEINKFKKVKLIPYNKRGKFGAFNQMHAYREAFKKSNGEIIFFLDSDDFFHKNKISKVVDKFITAKNIEIIFDMPIYKYENKTKKKIHIKRIINNYWAFIHPQSCIAIRRDCLDKIFNEICFESFSDIWMDFRISIYSKYISSKFYILKENLTFYRQSNTNISSNFKIFGKSWWKRRLQAHQFVKFFLKNNNIAYKRNIDYFVTLLLNKFIK